MSKMKKPRDFVRGKGITLEHGVVTDVRLADLHPDPDQPRKTFSEGALLALSDSIRERGVMVPLLVRYDGAGKLMIVDGERRWRAAKLAKCTVVPVLLRDTVTIDEQQQRLDQVGVNQQREPLKPMDLARVLRGLRDTGKTVNDIAATLAKQGHPAMKPAAIDELASLTDLPEWAQDMVNAEQVEAKAAGELLPLLARPGVEKHLAKAMKRAAGYGGQLLAHNVRHAGTDALEQASGVNLTNVESWHQKPLVHFAWKTRCKGCEHLQRWRDGAFCMHRKTFEEHNQEAKDAGLLPGGRRPEKPKPRTADGRIASEEQLKTEKDAGRQMSLQQKAREYLHACLCVGLIEELLRRADLRYALVLWRALKSPGSDGSRGAHVVDAKIPAEYRSLEQLAGELTTDQRDGACLSAAINIVNELPWRETHALTRLLWGPDLNSVWTLDRPFLDLFRKAELVHLAGVHGCTLPEGRRSWDALKGDEIKDTLLAQRDKLLRPAVLTDLYQGEIRPPFVPYGRRSDKEPGGDDDLETVCIGCGCTHTDPCEEGCGWEEDATFNEDAKLCVSVCSSCAEVHLERFEEGDLTLSPEAKARVEEREAMRGDDDQAVAA